MKVEEYAAMRDKYPMPADAVSAGTASDPETGDVIAIGIVTRRRTYNKTGYICQKDAPAELLLRRSALALTALRQALQGLPVHPRRRGVNRPRQTPGFICAPRPELTFGPHSWYRAD